MQRSTPRPIFMPQLNKSTHRHQGIHVVLQRVAPLCARATSKARDQGCRSNGAAPNVLQGPQQLIDKGTKAVVPSGLAKRG